MHPSRTRRVLLIAFAISLLVHLIGAHFMRFEIGPRNDQPEFVTLSKKRVVSVVRATPHPVPTQVPTPAHTPHPRAPVHAKPSRTATHALPGKLGPPRGNVAAFATPAPVTQTPIPVPTATPAGACPHPDASPAVAATPPPLDIAPEARAKAVSGTAAIAVKLDADGRVVDAAVTQSTGNGDLDVVAVSMARNATYTPKYVACKGVPSDYTFTVRFVAW
ncbi:MAG: TonB family protein [Vulcanimicrobiaceae bacterium]